MFLEQFIGPRINSKLIDPNDGRRFHVS